MLLLVAGVFAMLAVVSMIVGGFGGIHDTYQRFFLTEMRAELRAVASAESTYFAKHRAFTSDLRQLDSTIDLGNTEVVIQHADATHWAATASHVFVTNTCTISDRRPTDANTPRGTIACTDGTYTKAWAEFRAKRDVPEPALPSAPATCAFDSLASPAEQLPALHEPMDLGYPIATVDRLAIRRMLTGRKYDRLDTLLTAYHDSVRRDFRLEYRLFDSFESFFIADTTLKPFLDEWVRDRPQSGNARLVRATYYVASGFAARGTRNVGRTSGRQMMGLSEYNHLARVDVDTAQRLLPCNVIGYHTLMRISPHSGDTAMSRAMLEQGLAMQPYGFQLRARHMYNLEPRWGGSHQEMDAFARESDRYGRINPRLRALHGFAAWDQGDIFERAGDSTRALEQYNLALTSGDFWQFRLDRGEFYHRHDRNSEAAADLDRALVQRPQKVEALLWRSMVWYEFGRLAKGDGSREFREAYRIMTLAGQLDPYDDNTLEQLAFYRKEIPEFAPKHRP